MATPELEVEIKLAPRTLADLDALAQRERVGAFALRARGTAHLYSVYLDTRALSLLQHRVALRLREHRGRWEATAKWMGRVRGSLHERPELTVALRGRPAPRFRLPPGPLAERLGAIVAGRALEPILVTEIERRLFDVVPVGRGARSRAVPLAELALDRVRLRAPGKRGALLDQYGEVEIEWRGGPRADLVALGERLAREFHMVPSADSKFSRGLGLRWGAALPRAAVPEAPGATDTWASAARKVLGAQLARLREHDPGARRGDDPDALHQMRVAVRRARAALRFFEGGVPERAHAQLAHELRWLGLELGQVRDLDVQIAAIDARRLHATGTAARALGRLGRELRRLRARRQARLRRVLGSPRYWRLVIVWERCAHASAAAVPRIGRTPLAAVGQARLADAFERLRKRGRRVASQVGGEPSAEDLHALRIRMKRVRYALEFLRELTGKPGRGAVKRLVELQDLLGAHQDAVVAAGVVARRLDRLAGEVASGAYRRALEALLQEEKQRAEAARVRFRAVFRKFEHGRVRDDFRKALRSLSRFATAPRA